MRASKRWLASLLAVGLSAGLATSAGAFSTTGDFWDDGEAYLFVGNLGQPFYGSMVNAAKEWNEAAHDFRFKINNMSLGACQDPTFKHFLNGVEFDYKDCFLVPMSYNTLAITEWISDADSHIVGAGMTFHDHWDWGIYQGPFDDEEADFHRVALHELGHFLGLGHEDGVPAIMATVVGSLSSLQADDVDGVNSVYEFLAEEVVEGASSAAATNPVTTCQMDQLAAARKLCHSHFFCEAKRAKKPEKDADGSKRDACLAKATLKFDDQYGKALAAGGASCPLQSDAATAMTLLGPIAASVEAGILAGHDEANGDDSKLRSTLLKRAGIQCKNALQAEVSNTGAPNDAKHLKKRAKAHDQYVKGADKKIQKATAKGLVYGGSSAGDAATATDTLVDDFSAAVEGL